jgi:thymidylate synthase (FAD)
MGSDSAIVQAARVSYGTGTRRLREDRGLIRYLMRHAHTTPFEMCELKLHLRVPMDTWRQWIRHRTANVNEYSTRYSIAIDAAQRTPIDGWRRQASGNRQGSEGRLDPALGQTLSAREALLHQLSREIYQERLAADVAREQARKDLPLSTYTEAYWKVDLHNLLHFLRLRLDDHAQLEIRQYATVIGQQIVARWCPLAWEAFSDFSLAALTLSAAEIAVIARLTSAGPAAALAEAERHSLIATGQTPPRPSRERAELEVKLRRLGLPVPWAMPPAAD